MTARFWRCRAAKPRRRSEFGYAEGCAEAIRAYRSMECGGLTPFGSGCTLKPFFGMSAPMAGKEAVFSVLQRGGPVRSTHLDRVIGSTLRAAINEGCAPDAHIITDDARYYKGLKDDGRKHSSVNHSAKE